MFLHGGRADRKVLWQANGQTKGWPRGEEGGTINQNERAKLFITRGEPAAVVEMDQQEEKERKESAKNSIEGGRSEKNNNNGKERVSKNGYILVQAQSAGEGLSTNDAKEQETNGAKNP